jgi:serine/threonine-protein phosphatase CPPED1
LQAIAPDKPDFVIHTGDLTSSGKYKQYMQMLDIIRDFKIPIIFILGNHDINYRGVACFLHIFGPASFYFDINNYRFIFIDNTSENAEPEFVKVPDGGVKKEIVAVGLDNYQMNDLEKLIKGSDHNFITLHIPPPVELFRFHCFFKNGDNFISLLQNYASRIALVFSGHIHGYGELESGGVHYIVAGGAGASLVKSREGIVGRFNYVLVDVTGDKVSHTVHYID